MVKQVSSAYKQYTSSINRKQIYVLKEKSRNMKFNRLSPTTDFYSKFQSQLNVISGNILYLTHETDKIKKMIDDIFLRIQTNTFYEKKLEEYDETNELEDK